MTAKAVWLLGASKILTLLGALILLTVSICNVCNNSLTSSLLKLKNFINSKSLGTSLSLNCCVSKVFFKNALSLSLKGRVGIPSIISLRACILSSFRACRIFGRLLVVFVCCRIPWSNND